MILLKINGEGLSFEFFFRTQFIVKTLKGYRLLVCNGKIT